MYKAVTDVKPQQDYLLLLTFEGGENRIFDMKPYLELGLFGELKDLKLFNSVKVSFDTIEWENEADMDPEVLYSESIILKEAELEGGF